MNRFLPPYGVTRLRDSGRTDTFPDTRNLVQAKEASPSWLWLPWCPATSRWYSLLAWA